ncbi:MAG: aldo/keto reductase [Alphaproteobacteria bacterium]|nr:aldo/keto reductase [Alphaproteobacteria bacterium]
MQYRKIGKETVSSVGLGCMGFSHAYGAPTQKEEAERTIRAAYDMGYTFFDTAECYTGVLANGAVSYNEELVGNALRDVRDKVFIATKFGVTHNADKTLSLDSSPERIRRSIEGSLKRLGVERIDLYYQHRIDPTVSPETVATVMADLIKEGKIKYWGISEADEEYLRRAYAVCPVAAVQNRFSMMARHHEKLFPVLEELGIAFVAFSPMANGFLTGRYDARARFDDKEDYRGVMSQFTAEGMKKSAELIELLNRLAAEKNATPAQISLAWMLCKKPYIIPIPGSRKLDRLKENAKAAEFILTAAEIIEIDNRLNTMDFLVFGGSPVKK